MTESGYLTPGIGPEYSRNVESNAVTLESVSASAITAKIIQNILHHHTDTKTNYNKNVTLVTLNNASDYQSNGLHQIVG